MASDGTTTATVLASAIYRERQERRSRVKPHGPPPQLPSRRRPRRRLPRDQHQNDHHHSRDRPGRDDLRERGCPRRQPHRAGHGEGQQGGCHHCQGRLDHL